MNDVFGLISVVKSFVIFRTMSDFHSALWRKRFRKTEEKKQINTDEYRRNIARVRNCPDITLVIVF